MKMSHLNMAPYAAQQDTLQNIVVHLQARIRAVALWQGGHHAAEVYATASADDQGTLHTVLVQCLLGGLQDVCQEEAGRVSSCQVPGTAATGHVQRRTTTC